MLEVIIGKFENEFAKGCDPAIKDYLTGAQSAERRELLAELLHTDLELRIRNGQFKKIEDYCEDFPEIQSNPSLVEELIWTEIKIRQHLEPGFNRENLLKRFPDHRDAIDCRLAEFQCDSEVGKVVTNESISFSDESSRFRKQKLHGQGGLGNVWLARDLELRREVAIKEIKQKYTSSQLHRSRFAREPLITSQLEHPGIVPVYGLGHRQDGTPYFAMQFVKGRNYKLEIQAYHKEKDEQKKS